MMRWLTLACVLTLCSQAGASERPATRYTSPNGWRLQTRDVWDVRDRLAAAHERGMRGTPAVLDMMLKASEYDWLECGIVLREGVSLTLEPHTRVTVAYADSLAVTVDRIVLPDRNLMQYWDSSHGAIHLGLDENQDIYHTTGKARGFTERGKVRAIAYLAFLALPRGSGVTEANVSDVKVTGAQVRSSEKSN